MQENPSERRKENRIGLYTTIIFHLVVLIFLLIYSIGASIKKESSFILDFTQQEKQELIKQQEELKEFKDRVSKELDAMIAAAPTPTVRNAVVDANAIKARAEREALGRSVEEALAANRRKALEAEEDEVATEDNPDAGGGEEEGEAHEYSGPSVLSYDLEGRKAVHLPIPAYKGFGGGDVAVAIYVNRSGRVIKAQVIESASSKDKSLWQWAEKAALRSKFNRSDSAPDPQKGSIVYRFIAQ
ncbi:MAG: energy transducer TonB [Bacteroidales bacterium]|nr:energy transducer TonB [Bacteroidales bacterium]